MKRSARADEVLALVSDQGFKRKLAQAIKARGRVETTPADVRRLALGLLGAGVLDGVQATFRWDAERQVVDARVKGASTAVDEQARAAL